MRRFRVIIEVDTFETRKVLNEAAFEASEKLSVFLWDHTGRKTELVYLATEVIEGPRTVHKAVTGDIVEVNERE